MPASAAAPTLSVVLPVRDREQLIERAIRSVLEQTRVPDEILVVDDGSSDQTAAVARRTSEQVRVLSQSCAGAAAARNLGVEASTSNWIACLDSDDIWDRGHLARMAAAIEATAGAGNLYFADTIRPPSEGSASLWTLAGFSIEAAHRLCPSGTDWVMSARQPMMLQSSVFRRRAFLDAGGLDPKLVRRHDTHLFLRIGIGHPLCAVAGTGAIMTDDGAGGRLTATFDSSTRTYWSCTSRLYTDVLQQTSGLPPHDRRELTSRLASAHLRLGHLDLGEHHPMRAAGHIGRALLLDPARVFARMRHKLGLGGVQE